MEVAGLTRLITSPHARIPSVGVFVSALLSKVSSLLVMDIPIVKLPVLGGVRSIMEDAGRILEMGRQYLPAYMKNLKVANAQ